MPQFLSKRYNDTVSTVMAVFWLLVYVFVNLTSIIYLGALAINSISGISLSDGAWLDLGIFSIIVTLGGMKVIGYTDVIQVAGADHWRIGNHVTLPYAGVGTFWFWRKYFKRFQS